MKVSLKTNIIFDFVMFLAMALTSISGVVIKIIAPLRRVAHEEWVRNVAMWIVGESRRMWGKIHLWAGVLVLVLLVVHIVLHWATIDSFFKKHINRRAWRITLYAVLLILLLFSTIPWILAF
uniref:DUF4405 domain-containing protein n=1 Tax=Alistipes sp. TaxID=1872444 RepID=UPI004055D67F